VQGITVDLPLRAEGTTLFLAPLKVSYQNGVIASGDMFPLTTIQMGVEQPVETSA
jgi:hypothetical protein